MKIPTSIFVIQILGAPKFPCKIPCPDVDRFSGKEALRPTDPERDQLPVAPRTSNQSLNCKFVSEPMHQLPNHERVGYLDDVADIYIYILDIVGIYDIYIYIISGNRFHHGF